MEECGAGSPSGGSWSGSMLGQLWFWWLRVSPWTATVRAQAEGTSEEVVDVAAAKHDEHLPA